MCCWMAERDDLCELELETAGWTQVASEKEKADKVSLYINRKCIIEVRINQSTSQGLLQAAAGGQ